MKSFSESLHTTKNFRFLEQAMVLMAQNGIDPSIFVEWYAEEGFLRQDNLFVEGFWDNMAGRVKRGAESGYATQHSYPGSEAAGKRLGNFAQGTADRVANNFGKARDMWQSFNKGISGETPGRPQAASTPQASQAPQTNDQKVHVMARSALNDLSKRMGLSKSLSNKVGDPNFSNKLLDLIRMLKAGTNESNIEYLWNGFLIKECLTDLQAKGLNVEELVEWYIEERTYFKEDMGVNWLQKAGNWASNQWANVKNAWQNWGQGGAKRDSDLDQKAINNAISALKQLQTSTGTNTNQEFKGILDAVYNKLNDLNKTTHTQNVDKNSTASSGQNFVGTNNTPEQINTSQFSHGDKVPLLRGQGGKFRKKTRPLGPDEIQKHPDGSMDLGNPYSSVSNQNVGNNNYAGSGVYGDSIENKGEKLTEEFIDSLISKNNKFSWFGQ